MTLILDIYYNTDREIVETSLKTLFSRSHFGLFSPIKPWGRGWAKRDVGVTNRRYKRRSPDWWSLLLGMWGFSRFSFESFFTSRNVGFFPFQFRIVLTVLPFFKERLLAISLSASLKLSFWWSSPRKFCHCIKIWPTVWINRLAKVTWYDLFRSFL